MAKKKKQSISILRLVVAVIIIALTAVAVTGMFVDVINGTFEVVGRNPTTIGLKLFSDDLKDKNTTFMIISFIVSFIGLIILLVGQAGMILKKNINFVTFIGSAFAILGGILVFISSFILADSLKGFNLGGYTSMTYSPAIGIYLTTIASIIAGGLGFLSMTKVMR